jgi:hypothetical protein
MANGGLSYTKQALDQDIYIQNTNEKYRLIRDIIKLFLSNGIHNSKQNAPTQGMNLIEEEV